MKLSTYTKISEVKLEVISTVQILMDFKKCEINYLLFRTRFNTMFTKYQTIGSIYLIL